MIPFLDFEARSTHFWRSASAAGSIARPRARRGVRKRIVGMVENGYSELETHRSGVDVAYLSIPLKDMVQLQ
jgi:hypothetical protein